MASTYQGILERTGAITLLGGVLTNYYNGLLIVIFLIFFTISFLFNVGITFVSLFYTAFFAIPVFLFAHFRLVMRGRKAMRKTWELEIEDDILRYETGYPNLASPEVMELKIDQIKKILVKGNPTLGYFLEFDVKPKKEEKKSMPLKKKHYQLGLWRNPEDAKEMATVLSRELNKPIDVTIT